MFLKVNQGSLIYSKLFAAIATEGLRNINFQKWQVENLPEFNNDVLTQRSPWYIYADVVGWKLTGEVDKKVWQPVKGWEGYYEPNKRTKAGKAMRDASTRHEASDLTAWSSSICSERPCLWAVNSQCQTVSLTMVSAIWCSMMQTTKTSTRRWQDNLKKSLAENGKLLRMLTMKRTKRSDKEEDK